MIILKRVFLFVLILAFLSGLKYFLDKYSPDSIVFHYNLLTCIQYFLLIGLVLWVLLQLIWRVVGKRGLKAKEFWIIFLCLLAACEAYFYYAIRNSGETGQRFHNLLTEYYLTYEINFPPLSYDPVLSYTLKKDAVYKHTNIEFSNEVRANTAGLRDDSASLMDPEVICLGDSYTMGWGVEDSVSFSELIQQESGLKVLNAGITSYGTAREMLLLSRLDTSHVKYLILQYCYNDLEENEAFLRNGRYLPVGSQQTQDRTFKSYQLARTYFPFKYTLTLLRMYIRNNFFGRSQEGEKNTGSMVAPGDRIPQAADAFLNILSHSNINFKKWKIFIIDTNRYPVYDHHFLEQVEALMNKTALPDAFRESVHIIRFPELNEQRYFYPLDNHLNREGHRLVAEKIMAALKKYSAN